MHSAPRAEEAQCACWLPRGGLDQPSVGRNGSRCHSIISPAAYSILCISDSCGIEHKQAPPRITPQNGRSG